MCRCRPRVLASKNKHSSRATRELDGYTCAGYVYCQRCILLCSQGLTEPLLMDIWWLISCFNLLDVSLQSLNVVGRGANWSTLEDRCVLGAEVGWKARAASAVRSFGFNAVTVLIAVALSTRW